MKIEILNEKENPLLKRREFEAKITHDAATPSISEIRKKISDSKDIGKGTIIIDSFKSRHGSRETLGIVKVYQTKERTLEIEPKHRLIKNGLIEVTEGKPGGEKPKERKEEAKPEKEAKEEKAEEPEPKEKKEESTVPEKAGKEAEKKPKDEDKPDQKEVKKKDTKPEKGEVTAEKEAEAKPEAEEKEKPKEKPDKKKGE